MFMGIFLVLIKPSPAGVQTGLITEEHIFMPDILIIIDYVN